MLFSGQVRKMTTEFQAPIQYYLNLSGDLLHINALIDRKIEFQLKGYQCINCNEEKPLFRMGFCKTCFFESPYASESIIRPELSKAHLGIEERDLEIEKEIQLVPHIVYLAYTGDVKVGVTRVNQIPTRWIDQGATFALEIARTKNRYEAGLIEVALKERLADKTNYKKMLKDEYEDDLDLADFREKVKEYFPEEMMDFYSTDNDIWRLDFPYTAPDKVQAFTLDKEPNFSSTLKGIKGQYLLFEEGKVMNIRNHEGYLIDLITH